MGSVSVCLIALMCTYGMFCVSGQMRGATIAVIEGGKKVENVDLTSMEKSRRKDSVDNQFGNISPVGLKALYEALRSAGDGDVQAYLDDAVGTDFNPVEESLSLRSSVSGMSTGHLREERDCSFLTYTDRYCFIVQYAGFLGESWDTRNFDENKARFILDNFMERGLLGIASSVMCRQADSIMPLFAGDSTITPGAINGFFNSVPDLCGIRTV